MSGNRSVARAAECVPRPTGRRVRPSIAPPAWSLLAAVRLLACLVWRGLVVLAQVLVFVAEPVDEFVTAWLGIAAVVPRVRRWRRWWRQLRTRWRDHRDGVIHGEVMDGVWR